jgi:hypothetical protein
MMKKYYLKTTKNCYFVQEKPNLKVYYSYTTPIALEIDGVLKVSQNQWSITTAKHLNWIDDGNKKDRLKPEEFNQLLKQHKPEPDFLKTVSMVSSMFGMLMHKEDKSKVNAQKKRFFDNVQGLNFPDDWNDLPEEEKSKRLEKIESFNLTR